jgi:hypothetical protein
VTPHEQLQRIATLTEEKNACERKLYGTLAGLIRTAHRVINSPHARYVERQKAMVLLLDIARSLDTQAHEQPIKETENAD